MFEVKLLVTAPGLETAINNLAAAIAGNSVAPITKEEIVSVVAESLPVVSAPTEDVDDNETSTEEFDKWGLRHDPRIHTDSKSLNKGDGLWRQKKKLDEAFVDGVKRELIAEAVEAGRYTGPAELAPGYVAPVDPAPAVPAAPVAPVVPAAPAAPVAPVEQPVTTDPAKVYNTQVLQSALMQMFGQITGDRAAPLSQRIMGLYETQNVMQIDDPVKLKSIIELIERINAAPADAENIVGQAESVKQMGGAF
ncbi:helicase [Escherichia phage vB_EcoS_AVIO78A]|mgnify:CR=1 FL=1|nr:helicase [Escherichia phage vB_EcoS_AVIO78A]